MNVSLRRTQRGVSLIELMLALAIIAIILVIATRYFARANLSQQISNATDQVMGVRAAANSYLNDKSGQTVTLNMGTLVGAGYLPQSYAGTTGTAGVGINPWNGNISVAYTSGTTRSYDITITEVPAGACKLLAEKLTANANEQLGDKIDDSGCAALPEDTGTGAPATTGGKIVARYTR